MYKVSPAKVCRVRIELAPAKSHTSVQRIFSRRERKKIISPAEREKIVEQVLPMRLEFFSGNQKI